MKPTIETINGQLCTVVRKPFDAEYVKEQVSIGNTVRVEIFSRAFSICYVRGEDFYGLDETGEPDYVEVIDLCDVQMVTTLPALPRRPENNEATIRLLHAYRAAGLIPLGRSKNEGAHSKYKVLSNNPTPNGSYESEPEIGEFIIKIGDEITHAIDTDTGERVEIALEG